MQCCVQFTPFLVEWSAAENAYLGKGGYFEMEVCHSLRIQHTQNSVGSLITFQTSPIFPES
jgi:hypothetical protein